MHAYAVKPLVSVVMPVRNGAATIGKQLEALAGQHAPPPFEVVISDNGSTDDLTGALDAATRRWPQLCIRRIDSSARPGISFARNAGIRHACSARILICDSDDVVGADWVRELAAGLDIYDGVGGALDERLLNAPNSSDQTYAAAGLPVGLGFLPYPVGANCGVRREVWQVLGGFDEDYLLGAEEVDFYWRLQLGGYALGFVPAAVVAYRHRTGLSHILRLGFRRGIGSCQLAARFKTHIPPESLWTIGGSWARLIARLPLLGIPDRRLGYLRAAAHRVGQVVGSVRYSVIHLA
jgi:GT2 family glycosyltransferase